MTPSRVLTMLTSLVGIALVIAASLALFPVGCNSNGFVCYMDSDSWWSTYWPNFLVIGVGFLLLSIGAFKTTSPKLSFRLPIGVGLLLSGLVLLPSGIGFGANAPEEVSMGTGGGCGPMLSQYCSDWLPNYLALALGISLLVTGVGLVFSEVWNRRWWGTAVKTDGLGRVPPSPTDNRLFLKLLGSGLGVGFGAATLFLGATIAPFPPFFSGISYDAPAAWKDLLIASPLLLTVGFLYAGSAIRVQDDATDSVP